MTPPKLNNSTVRNTNDKKEGEISKNSKLLKALSMKLKRT
jgi:hypothetical protein